MTSKIFDIADARRSRDGDTDRPSSVITVGGPVDEASVALCIYGDDLVPEDISETLKAIPTKSHCKGEQIRSRSPRAPRSAIYRTGAWILEMRGKAPQEPEALTVSLLDRLPDDEAVWVELTGRYRVWLTYGLFLATWNRGFTLSSEVAARVARLHAALNFDIYADHKEQEP